MILISVIVVFILEKNLFDLSNRLLVQKFFNILINISIILINNNILLRNSIDIKNFQTIQLFNKKILIKFYANINLFS